MKMILEILAHMKPLGPAHTIPDSSRIGFIQQSGTKKALCSHSIGFV